MPHVDDCILETTGGPTVNDGLVAYFKAGAAGGNQLNELMHSYAAARTGAQVTGANMMDVWRGYLIEQGYTGSFNDMWKDYWCAGGDVARAFLGFNGTTTIVSIPGWSPDKSKSTIAGCRFVCTRLPDGIWAGKTSMFGIDSDFALDVNWAGASSTTRMRTNMFGENHNLGFGGILENIEYSASQGWPADVVGTGVGICRLNQRPLSCNVGSNPTPTGTLQIGFRDGLSVGYWNGVVADMFIFEDGVLVHHWPLDEGSGTVATDIVGGLNGTITDPTWVVP